MSICQVNQYLTVAISFRSFFVIDRDLLYDCLLYDTSQLEVKLINYNF